MPTSILGDLEGLQEEAGAEFDDDGVSKLRRLRLRGRYPWTGWHRGPKRRLEDLKAPGQEPSTRQGRGDGEDIDALMAKGPVAARPST